VTPEETDPVARAEALFREGYACSQAVLMAFASKLGIKEEDAAAVASAFGGGTARNGLTCGALTGAFMAIGLHAGNRTAQDEARKNDAYARVNVLLRRFVEEHGAADCRTLTGRNLADPVQRQQAADAGAFTTQCPRLVRTAAAFVAETLNKV